MPARDAVDDDDETRARGKKPLATWFRDKARAARERARAAMAKVRDEARHRGTGTRARRAIETESRAHAARVARAIARDDAPARGGSFAEARASRREALMEALGGDEVDASRVRLLVSDGGCPVSYTHLTLPTILLV